MWRLYKGLSAPLLKATGWLCLLGLVFFAVLASGYLLVGEIQDEPRVAHIFLKPATLPTSIDQLQERIEARSYVSKVEQISPDQGLEDIKPLLNALSVEKIDTYMLPVRFDVVLKHYSESILLDWQKELQSLAIVEAVVLPKLDQSTSSTSFWWLLPIVSLLIIRELLQYYRPMMRPLCKGVQGEVAYYRQVRLPWYRYGMLYILAYFPVVLITSVGQLFVHHQLVLLGLGIPWDPVVTMGSSALIAGLILFIETGRTKVPSAA